MKGARSKERIAKNLIDCIAEGTLTAETEQALAADAFWSRSYVKLDVGYRQLDRYWFEYARAKLLAESLSSMVAHYNRLHEFRAWERHDALQRKMKTYVIEKSPECPFCTEAAKTLDELGELMVDAMPPFHPGCTCSVREETAAVAREVPDNVATKVVALELEPSAGQPREGGDNARQTQVDRLAALLTHIASGIPFANSQRVQAHLEVADIYDQLNLRNEAAIHTKLAQESKDGPALLSEAREEFKSLAGLYDPQKCAAILDKLRRSATRTSETDLESHALIFRTLGEVMELSNHTSLAIQYYMEALHRSPDVGVKERLEALQRSAGQP